MEPKLCYKATEMIHRELGRGDYGGGACTVKAQREFRVSTQGGRMEGRIPDD